MLCPLIVGNEGSIVKILFPGSLWASLLGDEAASNKFFLNLEEQEYLSDIITALVKQEHLSDLITALVKLNLFFLAHLGILDLLEVDR